MSVLHFVGRDDLHFSKVFTRAPDGSLEVSPYPHVKNLFSYEEDVQSIDDLYFAIDHHSKASNALLVGSLVRSLQDESRAGLVDTSALHQVLVLDIDHFDHPGLLPDFTPIVAALGLFGADYVLQYSASMGLVPGALPSAHLFFLLDPPLSAHTLKHWALQHNLVNPILAKHVRLSRSGAALSFPLDVTSNEDNRLIYVAPPRLEGLDDPYPEGRIRLVRGGSETTSIDPTTLLAEANIIRLKRDRVAALRAESGLPPIRLAYRDRIVGDTVVAVATGATPVRMTGHREARGFAYFNFNDGDSWAYYHPLDSPDIIYNFKGEDPVLTREVLPDYYEGARRRARQFRQEQQAEAEAEAQAEGNARNLAMADRLNRLSANDPPLTLVFLDTGVGRYTGAVYHPGTGRIEFHKLASRTHVDDFCASRGIPVPEPIPSWQTLYNPTDPRRFIREEHLLNLYTPSIYRRAAAPVPQSPPMAINELVTHVMGNSQAFVDHFYNWLAFIFQTGRKAGTAFVITGCTGTGKGTLIEYVLRPLLGRQNVVTRSLDSFEQQFNSDLMQSQLVVIEESSTDSSTHAKKISQRMLSLIADETVPARGMYKEFSSALSYFSFIFTSNYVNVTLIERDDRRFNVPPRQETPLKNIMLVGSTLHRRLELEIQDFANFLMAVEVDEDAVRTPLPSAAKDTISGTTTDVPSDVAHALKTGDFDYFVDNLPNDPSAVKDARALADNPYLFAYVDILDSIASALRDAEGRPAVVRLARDQVKTLFVVVAGWRPDQTAAKFTKAVAHYGLTWEVLRIPTSDPDNPAPTRGIEVTWTCSPETLSTYLKHFSRLKPRLHLV